MTQRRKSPAFSFYPDSWIGGTRRMSLLEKGVYIELLSDQWCNGPFTIDMACRICSGTDAATVEAVVRSKFTDAGDGTWFNARLEQERENQEERRKKQSENGKKGGRPRSPENPKKSDGFNLGLQNEKPDESQTKAEKKPSDSVSGLLDSFAAQSGGGAQKPASSKEPIAQANDPIKEEKTLSAQKKAFLQFWSVYPEKGGKQAAEKAFCRAWTRLAKEIGQESATSKLAEAAADYRSFLANHPSPPKAKYAQGWLNDARYEDDFIEMLDAARWSAPQTKAGQRDQRTKEVLDGIFGSDDAEQHGSDAAGIGWIDGSVSS